MRDISNLVVNCDPIDGSTFVLLAVLYFLGARLVQSEAKLERFGKRIALTAFFLFVAILTAELKPSTADEWVMILLRSLLLAGIVLGAAWTISPVLAFAYTYTFGAVFQTMGDWSRTARRRAEQRKAEREQRKTNAAWEKGRPRREREARDAVLRAESEARLKGTAQKRCEDARLRSELLYERHSQQLTAHFPRERFEQFLQRYMHDNLAPDEVEQREQWLKEAIRESIGAENSQTPKFRSVVDIAAYFESRRQELEQLPHGEDVVDHYRVQINKQEDDVLRKFLKS